MSTFEISQPLRGSGYHRFDDRDQDSGGYGGGGYGGGVKGLGSRVAAWWHQLEARERKMLKVVGIATGSFLALIVLIVVPATLSSHKESDNAEQLSAPASPPSRYPPVVSPPPWQMPNAPPPTGSPSPMLLPPPTMPTPSPSMSQPPISSDDSNRLCNWTSLYLPLDIIPQQYDLRLETHLAHNHSMANVTNNHVSGHVSIALQSASATSCIVLHADNMNITSVGYFYHDSNVTGHLMAVNNSLGQVTLHFDTPLPANAGTADKLLLHLDFQYPLQEGLDGWYKSTYTDSNGTTQILASTQFESISARKAFPCFDEPRFKARFAVVLNTPPAPVVALNNMPESSTVQLADGSIDHTFTVTPVMSTYLVAFVVGQLVNVSKNCTLFDNTTIPVAVWATPDKAGLLDMALDVGCVAVQTFSLQLGVPYMLPKLDLVGIPNFAAGAMENWGLILYRESALLVNKTSDDIQQTFWIASVVSHEISHQWFGDLVTMDDWGELWLNEGFATYFEDVASDAFRPTYQYFDLFYTSVTAPALVADSLNTSHPLSLGRPIQALSEIDNLFDTISYEKGAAVLRMLRTYLDQATAQMTVANATSGTPAIITYPNFRRLLRLHNKHASASTPSTHAAQNSADVTAQPHAHGRVAPRGVAHSVGAHTADHALHVHHPERALADVSAGQPAANGSQSTFLRGVGHYLEQNAYNMSTYSKLWGALANDTGLPVDQWMRNWTLTRNYPLVEAHVTSSNATHLQLHVQQRPILAAAACNNSTGEGSWWVPLSFSVQGQPRIQWTALNTCEAVVYIAFNSTNSSGTSQPPQPPQLLLNPGRYGFYRSNYTPQGWDVLSALAVSPSEIAAVDLAGLLDDSYHLAEMGQLNATVFLELTQVFETRILAEYAPWSIALAGLNKMLRLLQTAAVNNSQYAACTTNLKKYILRSITDPFIFSLQIPGQNNPGLDFSVGPNEPPQIRLLRPLMLLSAGIADDTSMQQQHKAWKLLSDPTKVALLSPDVRGTVYSLAVMNDANAQYDAVRKLYLQSQDASEAEQLLSALTWASRSDLVNTTLNFLLQPAVKLQDMAGTLVELGLHGGLRFKLAWDFVLARMSDLLARYPSRNGAVYSLGRQLKTLTLLLTDGSRLDELHAFYNAYSDVLDPSFLDVASENIAKNQAWLQTIAVDVCAWLSEWQLETGGKHR